MAVGACLLLAAVAAGPKQPTDQLVDPPTRLESAHLANAIRIHPRVISGGSPVGDEAFAELRELGIRTVISVDGARPDVETARKYGLRYVHMPNSYQEISSRRAQELAKALGELPGPFYIHCHHGLHRAPTAAGVACVAAGLIDPDAVPALLKLAGTAPTYRGLVASARAARPIDADQLDALQVTFLDTVPPQPITSAMVEIEATYDHLVEIAAAGWQTPTANPDLQPAHEALLLSEHFAELLRSDEVRTKSDAFRRALHTGQTLADTLQKELARPRPATGKSDKDRPADAILKRITRNCKDCHQQYRDNPSPPQRDS